MSERRRRREAQRIRRLDGIAVCAVLPLAALAVGRYLATVPIARLVVESEDTPRLPSRLDPNAAPWWELTALSGIGESKAKAIVKYRTQEQLRRGDSRAVVFRGPVDLDAVKGIGPKTAARMAPYLIFPQNERGSGGPDRD